VGKVNINANVVVKKINKDQTPDIREQVPHEAIAASCWAPESQPRLAASLISSLGRSCKNASLKRNMTQSTVELCTQRREAKDHQQRNDKRLMYCKGEATSTGSQTPFPVRAGPLHKPSVCLSSHWNLHLWLPLPRYYSKVDVAGLEKVPVCSIT
jgi:hypothetical protein